MTDTIDTIDERVLPILKSLTGKRLHFVGIKGTGMAALVELVAPYGAIITGSDVEDYFYTDDILSRLGIKPLPFSRDNVVGVDLVIHSSAYGDTCPDIAKAIELDIPIAEYSEALGAISSTMWSIGVSGVHGKTTTTGIIGTILKHLPIAAGVLCGSVVNSFGTSCVYNSPTAPHRYFVAETCEYKRHFLHFHPQVVVLTSVESDHEDYYPTYEDIQKAFVEYALSLPKGGALVYCKDDKGAREVANIVSTARRDIVLHPYGEGALGAGHLEYIRVGEGRQVFTLGGVEYALSIPGRKIVLDTAGALVAVGIIMGECRLPYDTHIDALRAGCLEYSGSKRRCEEVGRKANAIFVDDYGHHPTAIQATLEGLREWYKRPIIVDFMSHTYSRTEALLDRFATAFGAADIVVVNDIYPSAREHSSDYSITGEALAACIRKAKCIYSSEGSSEEVKDTVVYIKDFSAAARYIAKAVSDGGAWLVVTMGAGDNWKVGVEAIKLLGGKDGKYN